MTNKEFLKVLLYTHTPSGYERLCDIDDLNQYVNCEIKYTDNIWNQYFIKGSNNENALTILISAHYDENAMQVVNITKEGMLHITNLGGLDRKTIEGSYVYVISLVLLVRNLFIKKQKRNVKKLMSMIRFLLILVPIRQKM